MRKHVLVSLSYVGLFILMSYPLFSNLTRFIPAFFSTDESYVILWYAWANKYFLIHNMFLNYTNLIAYPFGIDLTGSGFIWLLINSILSVLTTPILTYNLQIIANYLLNSFLTYYLTLTLTKSRYAAFLSGAAFGFCPYIFARSWQHLGETYLWMIPLVFISLFKVIKSNDKAIIGSAVIAIVLTTINFNVVQYMLVILPFFLLYICFFFKFPLSPSSPFFVSKQIVIKNILIIYLFSLVIVSPQFISIIKNRTLAKNSAPSAWNVYHRPFEDLFTQSARPLSYFLPSVAHPVFGKFTEQFVGTKFYGMSFTEHTLYLGWISLILAFVAFRNWKKRNKPQVEENNYIGFFVLLAIVAWFWSQPPWWDIFGFKIYMPSFFMYKILPIFRAYCRFGVVVMFAVAVLAGFGLKFILERCKSQRARIFVTVLFCSLVLFEFWNWPPYKVIDVSNFPAVYSWLREQPKNIVIAEYPLDAGSPNEMYKLYQIKHGKRMINCTIPGTPAHAFAQKIIKLSDPHIIPILKRMRVNYILVHHQGYLKTGLFEDREELERIPGNNNLRLIKSYPGEECPDSKIMCIKDPGRIDLYEIALRSRIK